jgi:hypothetical protein
MANTFRAQDAACARCSFFDDHAAQGGVAKAGNGSDVGLCRYNPPISQPSSEAHGLWPVVSGTDWCGHYEPQGGATAGTAREGARAAS